MSAYKLLFAAPLVLLATPSIMLGLVDSGWPPERFKGDASTMVAFLSQEGVEQACGKPEPPIRIMACVRRDFLGRTYMFAPNPNRVGDEEFRRVMAHELGHVNGWGREHEL